MKNDDVNAEMIKMMIAACDQSMEGCQACTFSEMNDMDHSHNYTKTC